MWIYMYIYDKSYQHSKELVSEVGSACTLTMCLYRLTLPSCVSGVNRTELDWIRSDLIKSICASMAHILSLCCATKKVAPL